MCKFPQELVKYPPLKGRACGCNVTSCKVVSETMRHFIDGV
jgi:hypothetical protein